jgi:hypothetical protein
MEPTPKIKLPIPYKEPEKTSRSLQKIDTKLKSLNKTGSEKILTFIGSNEVEAMFYLYLFKKYKSNCFLYDKDVKSRILGMSIEIKTHYNAVETTQIENQLDNLAKLLVDCIKRLDTKIIIIPVQLLLPDKQGHANVLIYRKNLNQIEHFEPHGQNFGYQNDNKNAVITRWMKLFIFKINAILQLFRKPEVKFIESSDVCPYIDGLQNLEGWSDLTKLAVEPGGYCSAWSMFFTELCLKNPEVPSSTLMNYIFDTLQKMPIIKKKDYLRNVIRGYSVFINEKIYKYFSIFFKSGLTIEKIKSLPRSELFNFRKILQQLINIEMKMATDPLYIENTLKSMQTQLNELNKKMFSGDINKIGDISKEIDKLIGNRQVLKKYQEFNVVSNPSESISHASLRTKSCPEGKELNPKTGRCVKSKTQKVKVSRVKTPKQTVAIKLEPKVKVEFEPVKQIKSCPEGKELNPKTGRCVKSKTQKVRKIKTPKQTVEPKIEPKVESVICPEGCVKIETVKDAKIDIKDVKKEKKDVKKDVKKEKRCPEGKELNPKTGRCVKSKTQKVKK